jgi:hypothetical protein
MTYGKRKPRKEYDPTWRKPTSPSRRKDPWMTVSLRAETYTMVRELADFNDKSCGEVIRDIVEKEFQKTLWKIQQETLEEKRGASHDRA